MDDQVDEPVRQHHQRGADRRRLALCRQLDEQAEQRRPHRRAEQAVRIGHVVEVHRVHRRDAGRDPHRLYPRHQQRGEADVDKLRRDEQRAESGGLRTGGGDEGGREVTDEHRGHARRRQDDVKLDRKGAKGPKQGA